MGPEVVYRKNTKWGKFKGRVKSWFGNTKEIEGEEQIQDLPRILITSPEDSAKGKSPAPSPLRGEECEVSKETPDAGTSDTNDRIYPIHKKIVAEKEDLVLAHQDVIAHMRESLLEARGGGKNNVPGLRNSFRGKNEETKSEGCGESNKSENEIKTRNGGKPPVPPTKAKAVAKIRETIAQAKQENVNRLSRRGSYA